MNHRDRFSANLRRARQASGISQEELAERCEIHRTEVSLLERGGREPRLGTMVKLATALGTTGPSLFGSSTVESSTADSWPSHRSCGNPNLPATPAHARTRAGAFT